MLRSVAAVVLGPSIVLAASPVFAQSNFDRNRNVSVAERPQPSLDARGVHLGGIMLYPSLDAGAEYNDNIFAQSSGKIDDIVLSVKPALSLQSGWSVHSLTAHAWMQDRNHLDNGNENTTDWDLGASGRLDIIQSLWFDLGGGHGRYTEPRTSTSTPAAAVKPVRYDQSLVYAQLSREMGRLRTSLRGDWRKLNYKNGRDATNGLIFQDGRDREISSMTGRVEYALSPAMSVFVYGAYNRRAYQLQPPLIARDRSSKGYDVAIGSSFDLSNLARGELRIGYMAQKYDDAGFSTARGLSGDARIEWFPSQLTTVTFSAARSVEDAVLAGSPSYLSSTIGLRADHELLRNILLNVQAGYQRDKYELTSRKDQRFSAGAGANWRLNRNLGLGLQYEYLDQQSDGAVAGPEYKINRLMLTTRLQI